jgi:hypothetical protein
VLHAAGDVTLPGNVLKLMAGLMRAAAKLAGQVEPSIREVDAAMHGHAGRRPRGWGSLVATLRTLLGEDALSEDQADAALHLLMPPAWLPPHMRGAASEDGASEEWHSSTGAAGGAPGEAAATSGGGGGGGLVGLVGSSSGGSDTAHAQTPARGECAGGASRQPPWPVHCSRSPCMVIPLKTRRDQQAAVAAAVAAVEGGDGGGGGDSDGGGGDRWVKDGTLHAGREGYWAVSQPASMRVCVCVRACVRARCGVITVWCHTAVL